MKNLQNKVASKTQLLSIVIPCFNEEAVITETITRLLNFAQTIMLEVEFIFVDDGSSDQTKEIIKSYLKEDKRIRLIVFSRNFGHQIAVTAGINAALGDAVVLIDADLQDPPELIHEMLSKWHEGFDVVYATRTDRAGESLFKIATARYFYRFLNLLSDVKIPPDTGDFRLMSRSVVDAFMDMPERDRFVRGMVSWIGFRQTSIKYSRAERFAGETKYPLRKMLRFAIDGILSFSTKPLQISITLGFFSASVAMICILWAIFMRIFTSIWVEGWTALMIAILFIGGVQLICIGILGEYIGRIYNEVKSRPLFVIQNSYGFEQTPSVAKESELQDK